MKRLFAAFLLLTASLSAATCVPQSGSTKNAQDLNDRACASETFTAGTGGVTANTLVIPDASSPARIVAGTGSGGYGVALSTVAATGSVQVQRYGQVLCTMDNAATAGDLVIPGISTPADCRDSGQTASSAISSTTRIIGVLLTSASSGATAVVSLTPAHFGTLIAAASGALGSTYIGTLESTTSTSFVNLTTHDAVTFSCAATCNFTVQYAATANIAGSAVACTNSVFIDGTQADNGAQTVVPLTSGFPYTFPSIAVFRAASQSSGSHTVEVRHLSSNGSLSCGWSDRLTLVTQVP